jgi:TolA-binding protein
MTAIHCPRCWEVDTHREGRLGPMDAQSFERHCRTCAACTEALARDDHLRALGKELPIAEPGQLTLKRLRARVLRDATGGAVSASVAWRHFALGSMIALVMIVVLSAVRFTSRKPAAAQAGGPVLPPAPLAGSVIPGVGAVWRQSREGGVERVELETGSVQVQVRAQTQGERFLVELPDGEIEVRGTTFEVTALDGSTRHIGVNEGTVVLRLRGSGDLSLGPGAQWAAQTARPPISRESTAVEGTGPAAAPSRRPSREAHEEDTGASVYSDAIQSFRDGRYDRAAAGFHAFALGHPQAPAAEDASFLEAVSLAQAGRTDAAALAAERHLEGFPRSFRRKEASILVARAASRRGDCDQALKVLAAWTGTSTDAEVQTALRACRDAGPARP